MSESFDAEEVLRIIEKIEDAGLGGLDLEERNLIDRLWSTVRPLLKPPPGSVVFTGDDMEWFQRQPPEVRKALGGWKANELRLLRPFIEKELDDA